jgi:nucleotide-binding universal stress UspA family protein
MIAPIKNRLQNILLADDGSPNMRPAIQLLSSLPHEQGCVITALRVFTPMEGSEFSRVEKEAEKTRNLLKSRHFHFKSELVQGYASDLIPKFAEEQQPDLIVMGGKAVGSFGGLLGNVAADVLHQSRQPVLIVREPFNGLKRVLLVTDGSPASRTTCEYLSAFPLPAETEVVIMHVVIPVKTSYPIEPAGLAVPLISPEEEHRLNEENMRRGREFLERAQVELEMPNPVILLLRSGDPFEEILKAIKTENIDMLVCGSRGSGNLAGWLMGSISRELVRQATCSVLVVRTLPVNE